MHRHHVSMNLIFNFSLMSIQAHAAEKPSARFPYDLEKLTSYIHVIHPAKYMQIEWLYQVDLCDWKTAFTFAYIDLPISEHDRHCHSDENKMYTGKKQLSKLTPNSFGLKDRCVFVQTTVPIWNPPHYNGDIGSPLSLTHWGRDKMAAIFQTTFPNEFCWMKMYVFQLRFHGSLSLGVELTISQHWFR